MLALGFLLQAIWAEGFDLRTVEYDDCGVGVRAGSSPLLLQPADKSHPAPRKRDHMKPFET